ncbi:MAG: iron-containing alcohol dehydrogenase [Candidatus Hydrogenedentes bacterium]|nr:iron-containing alcohol dehydrogenase [Candidatus Hydrogenedentota bacterium]
MNILPESLILPPQTRQGKGSAEQLLAHCEAFGQRGYLVCGQSQVRNGNLDRILANEKVHAQLRVWIYPGDEPTLSHLEELLSLVREHNPHWIAALGGGSVLDIAKAAAGLHHAPLPIRSYHDGTPIPPTATAFIAVPTTAGTGSEATMVSVLTNEDTGVKKSIRHPSFLARLVVLDPQLLEACPPPIMAASGMDALTQAIESYCSRGATWLSDTFAIKAFTMIYESLEKACLGNVEVLPQLLEGSFLAGIALSNARLGLVHGLAHPLGARFHIPHGKVCAVCLPYVLRFNRESIEEKYVVLTHHTGDDLLTAVEALNKRLGIENPFIGKTLHDPEAFIEETLASGSTQANPKEVTEEDVSRILDELFQES